MIAEAVPKAVKNFHNSIPVKIEKAKNNPKAHKKSMNT